MGITATEVAAKDAADLTLTGIFECCQAVARASSAVTWSARTAGIFDITASLRALGVSRYDVTAKVLVLETTEDSAELKDVSETPLPAPIITGPLFVNA